MRSMFTGVSGLRAHQEKLDVIGNNIANVNTIAYKASRATFQEIFSQTLKGSGAPDDRTGRGGTNPMQIGLGMGIASVDMLFTRGGIQRTDNPTDLSIEGDGLFIVRGSSTDSYKYTRAGNFSVDKLGNIVASNGMNLYGWQFHTADPTNPTVRVFDTEKAIEPINIYSDSYNGNKKIISPKSTDQASFTGNLDLGNTSTDPAVVVPLTVYNAFGVEYKVEARFTKDAVTPHLWNYTIQDTQAPARFTAVTGSVTFSAAAGTEGKAASATGGTGGASLTRGITLDFAATSDINFSLDLSRLTEYEADSSAKVLNVNGYASGNLTTFNLGSDGIITGIYSNGQQQPLGLIALATFENPNGLQKVGENMFIATANTGEMKKPTRPGADGAGTLNPGTLEMSNVDISKEFTEMITTQRGFQANSRVITTSDEVLQELVNIKK